MAHVAGVRVVIYVKIAPDVELINHFYFGKQAYLSPVLVSTALHCKSSAFSKLKKESFIHGGFVRRANNLLSLIAGHAQSILY